MHVLEVPTQAPQSSCILVIFEEWAPTIELINLVPMLQVGHFRSLLLQII